MRNISLPIFQFDGGPRLTLEPSNHIDRVRLVIHDTADRNWRGGDIILSLPVEQQDDLAKAVLSFNHIMRLVEVSE